METRLDRLLEDAIPLDGRTPAQLREARARLLSLLVEWGVIELPGGRAKVGGPPRRRPPTGAPRLTIVR
jgi:hypothetical protein